MSSWSTARKGILACTAISLAAACQGIGDQKKSSAAAPAPSATSTDSGSSSGAGSTGATDSANANASSAGSGPALGNVAGGPASNLCSPVFLVQATANPWLAGEPAGTKLDYSVLWSPPPNDGTNYVDVAPDESPVLVSATTAACLTAGQTLVFNVTGGQASVGTAETASDPNGNTSSILKHALGGVLGKSDINAPSNSLLGVFLTNSDPSNQPSPSAYDFSTQTARDYTALAPAIGQVFFIGSGKTTTGAIHLITVPVGATRLYLGLMDSYQWNNNIGSVSVSIQSGS